MKNKYISQLQDAALKGRRDGILLGLDICAIALNRKFGFGEKRLAELEKEVQEILNEINTYQDTEQLAVDLAKSLAEIRKSDRDFFLRRYIKM